MLLKMYKYDMKNVSPALLIIHGIMLVLGVAFIILNLAMNGKAGDDVSGAAGIASGLLIFFMILSMFLAVVMTHLMMIVRFYKRMFTGEGYLTNVLPLTADEQMLSHLLAYVTWCVIDFLVFVLLGFIWMAANGNLVEFFTELSQGMDKAKISPASIPVAILMLLVIFAFTATFTYFSTAIGSLSSSHKKLLTVIMYAVAVIISQIVTVIAVFLIGTKFVNAGVYMGYEPGTVSFPAIPGMLVFMAVLAALGAAFYFTGRTIISRHLNLG